MPITPKPSYPYPDTGILWLDSLLRGMQSDPFSIMPGMGGSVLGRGFYANNWRTTAKLAPYGDDLALMNVPREMIPMPEKGTANALSAALGGRASDSLHTLVPERLSDVANRLNNFFLDLYTHPGGDVSPLMDFLKQVYPVAKPPKPPVP